MTYDTRTETEKKIPSPNKKVEPDTKGKPGAGAGPVGVPAEPADTSPDVDAGSQ